MWEMIFDVTQKNILIDPKKSNIDNIWVWSKIISDMTLILFEWDSKSFWHDSDLV